MYNKYFYNLIIKILGFTILVSSIVWCQIPNPGFENWTNGEMENWQTNNTAQFPTVTQSTNAHSGSYSVKGAVTSFSGFSFAPVIATSFPYTERPANFSGYYEFTSVSSDTLFIVIAFYKNNNAIGGGIFHSTANMNSYAQFNIPIIYVSSDVPDSAGVSISITPFLNSHSGSEFFIDDLSFSGSETAVNGSNFQVPMAYEMKQNYPNPFNPSTTIEYKIPILSHVSLIVYDILGNQVASLVNEEKPAGNYSVNFNASNLTSGVYFYKIQAGNIVQTKKLIVLK